MTNEEFLSQLVENLQRRGLADQRINDIVSETENHLDESGEDPLAAFGPVEQYAEDIAVQDEEKADTQTTPQFHNRTFRATAFDEMGILAAAGKDGWELVDVGALALFCRRPANSPDATRWEYKRRTGCHRGIILREMQDEQWQPCGNWLPFHYFKRQI